MSKTAYLASLEQRLENIESRIRAEKNLLESGSAPEKVEAAGELAYLEKRLSETREEIAHLEAEPDGVWESLKVAIEQNLESIEASLVPWAERQERAYEKSRGGGRKPKQKN